MRASRGSSESLRVATNTKLPRNWETFIRVDSNKSGLFLSLADAMERCIPPLNKLLITTKEGHSVKPQCKVSQLGPCSHEEAYGRLLLHVGHVYGQGHRKIMSQASDDVLVIAIATANIEHGCKLWITFSYCKTFRYVAVHSIANSLGGSCSQGLLFLHAFSGCDTVSSFYAIAKKTMWEVWRSSDVFKTLFMKLQTHQARLQIKTLKL